jgi:hypothetical protein
MYTQIFFDNIYFNMLEILKYHDYIYFKPYKYNIKEDIAMINIQINKFFIIFSKYFRQNNLTAFETVLFLAVAHLFGCYNPKQLADYLGVGHQRLYEHLKKLSLHTIQKLLVKSMVSMAAELLKPILSKSASTISRANITLSVDNSVIDRLAGCLGGHGAGTADVGRK